MWPLRSHHTGGRSSRQPNVVRAGVLAIVPESCDARPLVDLVKSQQWDLTVVHAMEQALWHVARRTFPVILLDRDLRDRDLLDRDLASSDWRPCVRKFAQLRPIPSVILISAVADHYLFDELVKQGGFDVIAKPLQADELRRIARLAFTFWKSRSGHCGSSANG